jgi:hypothetical protein
MTKNKHLTLKVKGIEWKVFIQTPAAYKRKHGNDSDAITYPDDKELHFKKDHVRFGTCLHEVWHLFIACSGINSASLTVDQFEEVSAEILEEHYFDIGDTAKKIMDFIAK